MKVAIQSASQVTGSGGVLQARLNALQAALPIKLGDIPFVANISCLYHVYVRAEAYLAVGSCQGEGQLRLAVRWRFLASARLRRPQSSPRSATEQLSKKGREFAAWLGIVPGEYTTGGKQKLLGISKRGNSRIGPSEIASHVSLGIGRGRTGTKGRIEAPCGVLHGAGGCTFRQRICYHDRSVRWPCPNT